MRIALFGVGAMGCLFGARLNEVADVTLVGRWPEQLEALKRGRLRITTPGGRKLYADLTATDEVDGLDPVDVALIVTKSARTAAAAEQAAQVLKPEGAAITLQNGIGNAATVAAAVGVERTTMGVTTEGAATDGPGVLRYAGPGTTSIAARPAIRPTLEAFVGLLKEGGLAAELVEDVSALAWGKLAVNAAINPLTALLRVPNGALLESEWSHTLLREAAREVGAVAAAKGITLPYPDPAAEAERVADRTAANRSSMLQDVLRGVETEIEVINGSVMREGAARGVPTPVNATLYGLVKALQESRAQRISE